MFSHHLPISPPHLATRSARIRTLLRNILKTRPPSPLEERNSRVGLGADVDPRGGHSASLSPVLGRLFVLLRFAVGWCASLCVRTPNLCVRAFEPRLVQFRDHALVTGVRYGFEPS